MVANKDMNTIDQNSNPIDTKQMVNEAIDVLIPNNTISRTQTTIHELKERVVVGEYCIDVDKLSDILVRNM